MAVYLIEIVMIVALSPLARFQCKRKKGTTPCSYHTVPEKMVMMVAMKQIHHLVSTMCEEEKMVKEMLNNGGLDLPMQTNQLWLRKR